MSKSTILEFLPTGRPDRARPNSESASEPVSRAAVERLRERAALVDAASDAIVLLDLTGCIRVWNRAATRIYGIAAENAVGQRLTDVVRTDGGTCEVALDETLAAGHWAGELVQYAANGRQRWLGARWTLLRDDRGAPVAIAATHTDVTEQRQLHLQLLRAQRLESVGSLAGGIAHDLNNILTPILMSIALLDEQLEDPDARRLLGMLDESAQRGATMVQQILALARGVDRPQATIDLRRVLEDVRRLIAGTFPRSIEIVLEIAPGVTEIKGDATQLQQAIVNLCLNARDAMPNGGRLILRAEPADVDESYSATTEGARPGRYMAISVGDTGRGITPDVRGHLFEPFFTTKSAGEGTGLGLATAHSIVTGHGGFVALQTEPGRGTTFQLFMPALPAGAVVDQHGVLSPAVRGRDELILVVDDEASIRTITAQVLSAHGYRVITCANGAEAVAEFAKRPQEFAAVVTDMMMPVMDGPCTLRALQTIAPDVKVIAASGAEGGGAALDKMPGVAGVLPKPFRAETMLLVLRQILDR